MIVQHVINFTLYIHVHKIFNLFKNIIPQKFGAACKLCSKLQILFHPYPIPSSLTLSSLQYQSIHRQSSVWKDSLRGGHFTSCSTQISGLKRITLNLNPNVKDTGAALLAQALEDDIWIKGRSTSMYAVYYCHFGMYTALDMQTCGLTSHSAHLFQLLLRTNTGLVVLDIRENALMGER